MNFTLTKGPEDVVNYVIIHGSARSFVNKNAGNIEQDERLTNNELRIEKLEQQINDPLTRIQ